MNQVFVTNLAGRYYHQGPTVVDGTLLQFEREANNVHDPNAIRVTLLDQPDQQIGYVPRPIAMLLAPYMDSGLYTADLAVARRRPNCDEIRIAFLLQHLLAAYA